MTVRERHTACDARVKGAAGVKAIDASTANILRIAIRKIGVNVNVNLDLSVTASLHHGTLSLVNTVRFIIT